MFILKPIKWIIDRLRHKIAHLKLSYLAGVFKEHGVSLVVIIVIWEIIEDVLFPILFIWLGNNVHPAFLAGAPISWLICLHWLMVPITWGLWMRVKGEDKDGLDSNFQQQNCSRDIDITK